MYLSHPSVTFKLAVIHFMLYLSINLLNCVFLFLNDTLKKYSIQFKRKDEQLLMIFQLEGFGVFTLGRSISQATFAVAG